jgi:hypothetical protein
LLIFGCWKERGVKIAIFKIVRIKHLAPLMQKWSTPLTSSEHSDYKNYLRAKNSASSAKKMIISCDDNKPSTTACANYKFLRTFLYFI